MKQAIAIFIIFALLFQTFSKTFVVADYFLNTASYAKNCENKARPGMHCNGKCQMMKKILQEEKKDQENTERRENLKYEVLSSNSFFATIAALDIESISLIKIPPTSDDNTIDRCFDIFHPPQA